MADRVLVDSPEGRGEDWFDPWRPCPICHMPADPWFEDEAREVEGG